MTLSESGTKMTAIDCAPVNSLSLQAGGPTGCRDAAGAGAGARRGASAAGRARRGRGSAWLFLLFVTTLTTTSSERRGRGSTRGTFCALVTSARVPTADGPCCGSHRLLLAGKERNISPLSPHQRMCVCVCVCV